MTVKLKKRVHRLGLILFGRIRAKNVIDVYKTIYISDRKKGLKTICINIFIFVEFYIFLIRIANF